MILYIISYIGWRRHRAMYPISPSVANTMNLRENVLILCAVTTRYYGKVWRYQSGNQKPYIEERRTIQWKKAKKTNNNIQSTIQKAIDPVKRTSLKQGWIQVLLLKSKQFLFHMWYSSCCYCFNPGDTLWMRKGQDCDDYDKRNISAVICDTDMP